MHKPVYANPLKPEICPFLALAVFILCEHHDSSSPYVFGTSVTNAETKFKKWFHETLDNIPNDNPEISDDLIAIKRELYGVRSFRKGSGTNASCSIFAPLISLFLRADWAIGKVTQPLNRPYPTNLSVVIVYTISHKPICRYDNLHIPQTYLSLR
jgi:hypothetical protein